MSAAARPRSRSPRGLASSCPFEEILVELAKHRDVLGGSKTFGDHHIRISRKVKAKEFRERYTDFEYIHLQVLGFKQLQEHGAGIMARNNGTSFKTNPAVRMLEVETGMTMHGERDGANHALRTAPETLLDAFSLAKADYQAGGALAFFQDAFDRFADPCLEGRLSRLLDYLEKRAGTGDKGAPPPGDLALDVAAGAPKEVVVGEHLRVFLNWCSWTWGKERNLEYGSAKVARQGEEDGSAADFAKRHFNSARFRAAMCQSGGVPALVSGERALEHRWEVELQQWERLSPEVHFDVERAAASGEIFRLCEMGGHTYEMHLDRLLQVNTITRRERRLRHIEQPSGRVWEVLIDTWVPLDEDVCGLLDKAHASGLKACKFHVRPHTYNADLMNMFQENMKTRRTRPLRAIPRALEIAPDTLLTSGLRLAELNAAIRLFEDLETLPPSPD